MQSGGDCGDGCCDDGFIEDCYEEDELEEEEEEVSLANRLVLAEGLDGGRGNVHRARLRWRRYVAWCGLLGLRALRVAQLWAHQEEARPGVQHLRERA